jgi:hypothetical protein
MRALGVAATAAAVLVGCAIGPSPSPRAFLEGRTHSISHHDVRQILSLAKNQLASTGRASHPIYCIYVERPDSVLVYHGEQRKHANDIEEALIIERVHGHWQLGEREIRRGVNIPTD